MRVPFFLSIVFAGLATAIPAAQAGPYTDGQVLAGAGGRTCTIEKGIDHRGGDYAAAKTSTFEQCVDLCTSSSQCATAQFRASRRYCYLKSTVNKANTDTGIDSVVCKPPTACNAVIDGSFEDVSDSALYTPGVTSGGWTLGGRAQFASNENLQPCDPESGQFCPPYVPSSDGYKSTFFAGSTVDTVSQTLKSAAAGGYYLSYTVLPFDGVPDPSQEDLYHCTMSVKYGGTLISSVDVYNSQQGNIRSSGYFVAKPSAKLVFSYKCPTPRFPLRVSVDSISTSSADPATCA